MYYFGILTLAILLISWPMLWHPGLVNDSGLRTIGSACWYILSHILTGAPKDQRYGYFLHITDMHVDSDYQPGATIKSACHTLPPASSLIASNIKSAKKLAQHFGTPGERCDAPLDLVSETLDWIRREWSHKLDFVIWTGDNSRHDWDKKKRRKRRQIYKLNQQVANLMADTFNVPLIPSIGNNDVFPHNRIVGQDEVLNFYDKLWRPWIPREERSIFRATGYFGVNVAPDLRVLALNTMFFFKRNKAVKACRYPDSPGYAHLAWFEQELEQARTKRIKVYVTGHVPPSPRDYKESCLNEFRRIAANYTDVIMGHFYGHLNMDHFLLFDGRPDNTVIPLPPPNDDDDDDEDDDDDDGEDDDDDDNDEENAAEEERDHDLHTARNIEKYVDWLRDMYISIDPLHDKEVPPPLPNQPPVVVVQVAPSVLPVYFPAVRIYRYKISHEDDKDSQLAERKKPFGTLLGYDQYYANITEWEEGPHDYQLEYTTEEAYGLEDLSVESYFDLAKRMTEGDETGDRLWNTYVRNMFVQSQNDTFDDDDDDS